MVEGEQHSSKELSPRQNSSTWLLVLRPLELGDDEHEWARLNSLLERGCALYGSLSSEEESKQLRKESISTLLGFLSADKR